MPRKPTEDKPPPPTPLSYGRNQRRPVQTPSDRSPTPASVWPVAADAPSTLGGRQTDDGGERDPSPSPPPPLAAIVAGDTFMYRPPTTTPPPPPPLSPPLEYRNSSKKTPENLQRMNTVDFVLAYQKRRKNSMAKEHDDSKMDDETERRRFYSELRAKGILVNVDDDPTYSLDAGRTCFALLRISQRLLRCRCSCHMTSGNYFNHSDDEQSAVQNKKHTNHQQYLNEDEELEKQNEKLTSAQRAQIVWHIILQIGFGNTHDARVMSLESLLEDGIFTAAYPVHDGNIKLSDEEGSNNINDRRVLYEDWARPGLIIPRQLKADEKITSLIRKYYGIPVAVYFCWLRYYTVWLVGPAIAGLVWFLYGFMTTRNDVPTRDICDPKSQVADWALCPTRQCEADTCGFTRVLDTCGLYRWTSAATFDRPGAVVFAVFMSFWAAAFQQLWTAYAWRLDEHCNTKTVIDDADDDDDNDDEDDLPYECCPVDCAKADAATDNRPSVTTQQRPLVPPPPPPPPPPPQAYSLDAVRRLVPASLQVAVFVVTLVAVAAVPILIVVYRGRVIGWLMTAVFHQDRGNARRDANAAEHHRHHGFFLLNYANSGELSNWKTAVAATCAAFVQLTAIVAVHRAYSAVAEWLTKYSYRSVYDPRYQSRYTAYMSCFDSANYYSSLVYIAFFKGRFVTGRAQPNADHGASRLSKFWPVSLFRTLVFHVREDVCDPAAAGTGCVPELCTQLAIIMVGKQLVDNAIELTTPLALNVWRRWRAKESRRRKKLHGKLPDTIVETLKHPKQWQLDYQLEDTGPLGLYQEYSEMVIQYGFVVMFTTAFPLAPLCALLNNVLEQRLDAYKMVAAQRRPVPAYYCTGTIMHNIRKRTSSCCDNCIKLGTWIRVLKVLSVISVLYNAFMIAFTSDLLPRYVYTHILSEKTSTLDGYVAWSLSSKRNVTEYYYGGSEEMASNAPEVCRYRGYGADSDSEHHDYRYWQVLAARLTFVIVFEHCVLAAVRALEYFVRKTVAKNSKRSTSCDDDGRPVAANDDRPSATTRPNGVATTFDRGGRPSTPTRTVFGDELIGTDAASGGVVVVDIENDDLQGPWRHQSAGHARRPDGGAELKNAPDRIAR